MRRNRSQTAKRRSHHALEGAHLSVCECGAPKLPHRACPSCGKYNGRVVIDVVARTARAQRRQKHREKELHEAGKATHEEKEKANA